MDQSLGECGGLIGDEMLKAIAGQEHFGGGIGGTPLVAEALLAYDISQLLSKRLDQIDVATYLRLGVHSEQIKSATYRQIIRQIVVDAAKEIRGKANHSHKLKGHQAAAQRQMQRINARKAMCEKAFGARS